MAIKYPSNCKTDADKNEFVRIALRKVHDDPTITGQEEIELRGKLGTAQTEIKKRLLASKDYTIGQGNLQKDKVLMPVEVDDDDKKLKWLHQALEQLRIERNQHAAQYRAGVITRQARRQNEREFEARSKRVHEAINAIHTAARNSTRWDPDLTDIEETVIPIDR
jgi:hypothetical protein